MLSIAAAARASLAAASSAEVRPTAAGIASCAAIAFHSPLRNGEAARPPPRFADVVDPYLMAAITTVLGSGLFHDADAIDGGGCGRTFDALLLAVYIWNVETSPPSQSTISVAALSLAGGVIDLRSTEQPG